MSAKAVVEREPWEPSLIIELVENAPSPTLRDAILIAEPTGLRASGITGLLVRDCSDGVISVGQGKTAAASETVPIHIQLATAMVRLTLGREPGYWLLAVFKGNGKPLVNKFTPYRKQLFGVS